MKLTDGTQKNTYFTNLEKYEENILMILGMETIDSEELKEDYEAMMFLIAFEKASTEEKLQVAKTYLKMKEIIQKAIEEDEKESAE